jgi:von Willebrand factor type A domain
VPRISTPITGIRVPEEVQMVTMKRAAGGLFVATLFLAAWAGAPARGDQPLNEENLTKLIALQIDDDAIVAKIKKSGLGFAVDGPAVDRLAKAGASGPVIAAIRSAASAPAAAAGAISYHDVLALLKLGLGEGEIIRRLEKSPTIFTLDARQVEELKAAGATEGLLQAMQKGRAAPHARGPRVTDFAIVLDCSGSMGEPTRDGQIKMVVARRVVTELIARMPEKLRVTLVIYGYDRDLNCQAVQVARPLGELGSSGKSELAGIIAGLQPVANTPIARALEVTGAELAKNDAPCGLVLLTDGKETCGGNPIEVAATLASKLNLSYGVNVIGFDVQDDERAALSEVARAGKGKYYNAQTAAELIEVVKGLQKELEVVARPAPIRNKIRLNAARNLEILPPTVQLPAFDAIYLTPAGTGAMALRVDHIARTAKYGQSLRIPPSVKAERFDVWWVPERGRAVRMIKDLTVDEPSVAIKPDEHLGLVRVSAANLPAASAVFLAPVGTADYALRAQSAQSAPGYGKDLAVAPGQYDVWIEPAAGGKAERIAEKVEVTAGQVTVIE